MDKGIYNNILKSATAGRKALALLIDPDKFSSDAIVENAEVSGVDYFFVGGSLLSGDNFSQAIERIKRISSIPVIIFPGSHNQVSAAADAILLLSLISGRNAEMLIGNHVVAAPFLRASELEIISTGYMLIDGGRPTSVSYMSNTNPIPSDKNEIAVSTAMAGEMLGLKLVYLDAGSGAAQPVNPQMLSSVKKNISVPLIVGGGIRTPEAAARACKAGADIVVIGTVAEENSSVIKAIAEAVHVMKNEKQML